MIPWRGNKQEAKRNLTHNRSLNTVKMMACKWSMGVHAGGHTSQRTPHLLSIMCCTKANLNPCLCLAFRNKVSLSRNVIFPPPKVDSKGGGGREMEFSNIFFIMNGPFILILLSMEKLIFLPFLRYNYQWCVMLTQKNLATCSILLFFIDMF